jgi:integral membrane protein (TIGR01906 family)
VLESALVGMALAAVVAGAVLGVLVAPPFTRMLVRRIDVAASSGLTETRVEAVSEQVRRFVTDPGAPPLPSSVDGAPAFDDEAVSHLQDVRGVLRAARTATGLVAGILVVWLGIAVVGRRYRAISSALRAGALCCVLMPVAGAVLATTDFDWFFSAFHGLFFQPGSWTFPADALLIRLFPETFWASSGVALAGGMAVGGLVLWLASLGLREVVERTSEDSLGVRA